jgi:hypothetical protein
MFRIEKKSSFFIRNQFHLFAGLWLLFALGMLLTGITGKDATNYIIAGGYFIIAACYVYQAWAKKDLNEAYIAWDEQQLVVSRFAQKPKTYVFAPELNIYLRSNHFIIKAPKAMGDMIELKDFKEEDLALLREKFGKKNDLKAKSA